MKKHLLKLWLLCCIGILAVGLMACVPTTEQYKLEFIVEGEVYYSQTTNGYSRINPPEDPSREGYSFAGWYFDEEYTEEYHSDSLEKNPIKQDTRIYAKWEKSDFHTCVASDWIIKTNATCKDEGLQVKLCVVDYCKAVMESKPIPISEKHAKTYTVEEDLKPATCSEKGSYISATYCTLCNRRTSAKEVTLEIDKNAHVYENGVLTKVDSGFNFAARCSICKDDVSLANVEVETEILTEATCTTAGEIKYVYPHLGGATTATETVPALGHKLAGVTIEDKVYSEITHKEILAKVELFVNDKACGEVIDGLYCCETCNAYCNIQVEKPHVGQWNIKDAPTCHKAGKERLDLCSACGTRWIQRDVAPTGKHTFIEGQIALAKDGDKFNLVNPCVNVDNGCVAATVIRDDVPVTEEFFISDNCYNPDIIRYSYNYMGSTAILDVVTASGHFLNGVRASSLADEEGWFHYSLITPQGTEGGIKMFADRVLACEETSNAYYNCTCCGEPVSVQVYRPHSGSWSVVTASTCTVPGVKKFSCDHCDYTETDTLELIDHKYSWKLIIDAAEDAPIKPFALAGTCYCGDSVKRENVLVTTNISKRPTCYSEGEIIYSHEFEGMTYYLSEKIPMTDHYMDNAVVDTNSIFDYAEYVVSGKIKIHAGQKVVCDPDATFRGFFVCTKCEEVITVAVRRVHSGEIVESVSPESTECIKVGTRHLDCVYSGCSGTEPVPFEEVDHKFRVDVIPTGDDHTVRLVCTVPGCGCVEEYVNVPYVNINVITLATCCAEGVIQYIFVSGDKTYDITNNIGYGNHMFHGVDYTTLMDADGKLPSDLEGLKIINSNTAAFVCDSCKHLVEVQIKNEEE